MKKAIIWILFVALLFLSGCSAGGAEDDKTPDSGTVSSQPANNNPSKDKESQSDRKENKTDSNEPRNEDQIAADIINCKFFKEEYSRFAVSQISIVKRQTDESAKTDKVYVTAHLINENENLPYHKANTIDGDASFVLIYGLYNNGWVLDTCEIDYGGDYESGIFSATVNIELDEEQLKHALTLGNSTTLENIDMRTGVPGSVSYFVTATTKHKYADETMELGLNFVFRESGDLWQAGSWVSSVTHGLPEYDWHLKGNYYFGENNQYHEYIPYNQPEEIIENRDALTWYPEEQTVGIADLSTMSFKETAVLIDPYAFDELSEGYSVSFWDGEDKNNNVGMNYRDFLYMFGRSVSHGSRPLYTLLFGLDKIAYVSRNSDNDDINHVVYFEIHEVTPIL